MFAPTKESKTPSLANHMSAAPHTVSDLRPVGIIDPSGICVLKALQEKSQTSLVQMAFQETFYTGDPTVVLPKLWKLSPRWVTRAPSVG